MRGSVRNFKANELTLGEADSSRSTNIHSLCPDKSSLTWRSVDACFPVRLAICWSLSMRSTVASYSKHRLLSLVWKKDQRVHLRPVARGRTAGMLSVLQGSKERKKWYVALKLLLLLLCPLFKTCGQASWILEDIYSQWVFWGPNTFLPCVRGCILLFMTCVAIYCWFDCFYILHWDKVLYR